ncbi:MAG: hypothetical protein AAB322_07015, partial [Pseudomonadota bacterium]
HHSGVNTFRRVREWNDPKGSMRYPLPPSIASPLSRINSVAAAFFEKKPALRHKSCCGVFFTGTAARQTAAGFSGALTAARAW